MRHKVELDIAQGYLQTRWSTVGDPSRLRRAGTKRGGGVAKLDANGEPVGRGDAGQSARSLMKMRRTVVSLPYDMLGPRPIFVALTYPGDWQTWVPDGRRLEAHRRAFLERWRVKWGAPIGVWAKEFQKRGAPHIHLYIGLADAVSAEDFEGLRKRTLLRRRLESVHGKFGGRKRLPAIGGEYGGDFGMWIRTAWSEVVGTQSVVKAHHARGVDVAVMFWSEEVARTKDRAEVAQYMAGEMAKRYQKTPPEGFTGVGNYFGVMGRHLGFEPVVETIELDTRVARALETRLERHVRLRMAAKARAAGKRPIGYSGLDERRWGDGLTAIGLGAKHVRRLLAWSEAAVERAAVAAKG